MLSPSIFREYDIRGIADRDLLTPDVEQLGQGFGTYLRRAGVTEPPPSFYSYCLTGLDSRMHRGSNAARLRTSWRHSFGVDRRDR